MPIGTIASILLVYVAIAALLLSLNLFSLWRWWVKATAIGISTLFFVGSYFAITSMLGLPTRAEVPKRFSLIATRIVEPNKTSGDSGSIYLWVEKLSDDNIRSGLPISYEVGYSGELADAVDEAQKKLDAGESVEGSLQVIDLPPPQQPGFDPMHPGEHSSFELPANFNLIFTGMPPVRLPNKGVL
jgi:hypothetical protein